jgi:hypothetical protein
MADRSPRSSDDAGGEDPRLQPPGLGFADSLVRWLQRRPTIVIVLAVITTVLVVLWRL